tara:strand:- start:626 stop:910 length:285 start_codon:yes stop_codon:yes gene_type:complete
MTSRLEQIRNDLNKYIDDQLQIDPANRDFDVFAFEEKLCEVIDDLDYIINYDPTPDADSPYSDAEYIITPKERDKNSLDSKRESHSHRYYSHNW